MKSLLKGAFVAGALALSVTATAKEADAAPATASWYGPGFAGQLTASGVPFDPSAFTAAHKTLPFGTQLEVCYQGCTVVTVNDRGPYVAGRDLDLSRAAADSIGLAGVGTVEVNPVGSGETPASGQAELRVEPASTNAGSYGGETYTVQAGDTLYGIAQSHGVSVGELAAANGISDVSLIFPGQTFSIAGDVAV